MQKSITFAFLILIKIVLSPLLYIFFNQKSPVHEDLPAVQIHMVVETTAPHNSLAYTAIYLHDSIERLKCIV